METGKHLSDELIRLEPQHDEAENGQ